MTFKEIMEYVYDEYRSEWEEEVSDSLDVCSFDELMGAIKDDHSSELDDYVEEMAKQDEIHASTVDLLYELEDRGVDLDDIYPGYNIKKNYTREELREHLLDVLGMGHYHTDEQIAERIREELSGKKKSRSGGSLSSVQQESKQIV